VKTHILKSGLGLMAAVLISGQALAATTTVQYGPIVLPAADANGPGQVENEVAGTSGLSSFLIGLFQSTADYPVSPPCTDCYITKIVPNLVLADGTTANFNNGTMLHHVVNLDYSRPDITCRPNLFSSEPIKLLGGAAGGNERFMAAGNERTVMEVDDGYGYYVGSNADWGLVYHLMNMSPAPKTVYFEYTFEWEPASGSNLQRTRPIWIDIDQCDDSEADAPAGYSDLTWDWKADRSHDMITIGGHIHDYGISTAWRNESNGQLSCTSVAGYAPGSPFVPVGPGSGADSAHPASANTVTSDPIGLANYAGHISDMTVCNPHSRTKKKQTMRLHTQINRPDATDHDMGIMIGFLDEDFCITNFWCF
jgi:hypothetical protein